MLKAYVYILIAELVVLAMFAAKPELVDMMQEIRDQDLEFEKVIGIDIPNNIC